MSIEIENRLRAAEKLVSAAQAKGLDPEVAGYYCKLGAVMVCGTIERCVEVLITDRLDIKSAPQVKSFLRSYFKRGTNYDCEEIQQLLHKFDSGWGSNFKAFVEANDRVKSSVSSCYAVRNSVAHGGSQSLGPKALKQYYDDAFTLVAELDSILKK